MHSCSLTSRATFHNSECLLACGTRPFPSFWIPNLVVCSCEVCHMLAQGWVPLGPFHIKAGGSVRNPPAAHRSIFNMLPGCVQEARPSVVHITTLVRTQGQGSSPFLPLDPRNVRPGSGSGFVWDGKHIVTNFHVIQNAAQVKATLSDQRTVDTRVVGSDPSNDLAVLRVDVDLGDVRPIAVGTSHDLMVGQKVFAIGNPFGLDQTLTGVPAPCVCVYSFLCTLQFEKCRQKSHGALQRGL